MSFVMLHAATAAGLPRAGGHADVSTEQTRFSGRTMADRPVFAILSLEQAAAPGMVALVTFEGGVREMEYQRNWAGASGAQAVALTLSGVSAAATTPRAETPTTIPPIGSPRWPSSEAPLPLALPQRATLVLLPP